MKKILLLLSISWLLSGCAEEATPPTHPDNWLKAGDPNSHMAKVQFAGIEGCQACHGGAETNDYFGGTSGVSCYDCHAGGPSGHPAWAVWMSDTLNTEFHGAVAIDKGFTYCNDCHGADEVIGITGHTCTNCH